MKRVIVFMTVAVGFLITGLFFLIFQPQISRKPTTRVSQHISFGPTESATEFRPFTATVKIIVDGNSQILSSSGKSKMASDVFLDSKKSQLVHVTKKDATWGNLFRGLPITLTDYCLALQTDKMYCTGNYGDLKFYLNKIETPKALEMKISPNEELIVQYESSNDPISSMSASPSAR